MVRFQSAWFNTQRERVCVNNVRNVVLLGKCWSLWRRCLPPGFRDADCPPEIEGCLWFCLICPFQLKRGPWQRWESLWPWWRWRWELGGQCYKHVLTLPIRPSVVREITKMLKSIKNGKWDVVFTPNVHTTPRSLSNSEAIRSEQLNIQPANPAHIPDYKRLQPSSCSVKLCYRNIFLGTWVGSAG